MLEQYQGSVQPLLDLVYQPHVSKDLFKLLLSSYLPGEFSSSLLTSSDLIFTDELHSRRRCLWRNSHSEGLARAQYEEYLQLRCDAEHYYDSVLVQFQGSMELFPDLVSLPLSSKNLLAFQVKT